jgi:nucleoid-associated protein YgaU
VSTSTLTIEELTGKKRKLSLSGAGLPFKPAAFSGEIGLVTQFYPGNRRGTQQVLAPKLNPSDWSGMWRTNLLLRSPCTWEDGAGTKLISYAHNLFEIFESLRDSGQQLRVTWVNESPAPVILKSKNIKTGSDTSHAAATNAVPQRRIKVVRIGRLKTFEARPDTVDDIGWTAGFEWVSKGDTEPAALEDVTFDLVSKIQMAITAQDGVVAANNTALKAPPTRFTLGDLENFAKGPFTTFDSFARAADSVTSRMHELGSLVQTVRAIPASLIGRALDVANYAVSTANNFLADMSRTPIEVTQNSHRVSMLTRSLAYYSGAMTQAQLMASVNADVTRAANRRRATIGQTNDPNSRVSIGDMITVYLPRDGDTMSKISRKFYNTDVVASALARANGLPGYTVRPPKGVPLVIPTRAVLDGLDRRTE